MSHGEPERSGPERPVLGVDGCRGGWVVVSWHEETVHATFTESLATSVEQLRSGAVAAMAVDMPIGMLDGQPRACDVAARKMLGPRRSSVFPTPVRATLAATDYRDACARSIAASGKALSKQAFNLLPKIAELDDLVTPQDQDRLVEAHPECAFVRLADGTLAEPKRTPAGREMRQRLLAAHDPLLGDIVAAHPELPVLDLIDAAVLCITARHVTSGTEHRLGTDVDATGLRAEVVF